MKTRHKTSSQILDEIFSEIESDFDLEGLTKEQIEDFHKNMFKSYFDLLSNDEFNRVYINKLGTFQPVPSWMQDIILKEEDSLNYYPKNHEVRIKKEKRIAKLHKEHHRVIDVTKNYNKNK